MRAWFVLLAMMFAVAAPSQAAGPLLDGKLPNGGRPLQHIAFPAIHDWRSLKITLTRTMCFGACPSYSVDIAGDGTVAWHGGSNVAVIGDRTAMLPTKDVTALYAAFRRAQFFWLYDDYRAQITDLPTYTVTISYDGHSKAVADYAGTAIGMPHAVVDLGLLIDKTANTAQWIGPAR